MQTEEEILRETLQTTTCLGLMLREGLDCVEATLKGTYPPGAAICPRCRVKVRLIQLLFTKAKESEKKE